MKEIVLVYETGLLEQAMNPTKMKSRQRGIPMMIDVQGKIQVWKQQAFPPAQYDEWCRLLHGWFDQVVFMFRYCAPFHDQLHYGQQRQDPVEQKRNQGM